MIHLLYLVAQIFLTYKRRLNILHDTKRKFLSISIIAFGTDEVSIKSFLYSKYPELAAASEFYHATRNLRRASYRKTPFGFIMTGHPAMQEGTYEPEQAQFLLQAFRGGGVFIDVGANMGYYTCLARHMGLHVISIEPLWHNLQFIFANLEANEWDDVEVFPLGLSDKPGTATLYGVGTAASLIKDWAGTSTKKRVIPLSTMDVIVGERLAGSRVIVKIDVEGSEYSVLKGSQKLLKQEPPPIWIVEVGLKGHFPGGVHPYFDKVFEIFWTMGYTGRTVGENPLLVTVDRLKKWITEKEAPPADYFVFQKGTQI